MFKGTCSLRTVFSVNFQFNLDQNKQVNRDRSSNTDCSHPRKELDLSRAVILCHTFHVLLFGVRFRKGKEVSTEHSE